MPPLKSSLIKPSKSMLFFHIWNANFSVTPINSQMYMTKPKQVQKKTVPFKKNEEAKNTSVAQISHNFIKKLFKNICR